MNAIPSHIRPGAIVRLKAGNRARIYAVDGGKGFPIHGAIDIAGEWIAASWREDLSWSDVDVVGACWTIVGPIPDEHCPPPVGDWQESLAERPAP